jgi:hypothetical protein
MAFNINDYETVEVRLGRFIDNYPDFMVHTELLENSEKRFIVLAKIYRTCVDSQPLATGLAYETITDRGVNQTSALENCETSAIGRALANAGYAAKGKRPSQSEMAKVIAAETESNPYEKKLEERRYGSAGTRSAAVEDAIRESFKAEKKEPEPVAWSIGDAIDAIGSSTPKEPPAYQKVRANRIMVMSAKRVLLNTLSGLQVPLMDIGSSKMRCNSGLYSLH